MSKTLILTGWGWKEYSVAAAIALKNKKEVTIKEGNKYSYPTYRP